MLGQVQWVESGPKIEFGDRHISRRNIKKINSSVVYKNIINMYRVIIAIKFMKCPSCF